MRKDVKELNDLIETISSKVVSKAIGEKYLLSRMAVIVKEFDSDTNTASIIIPTDLEHPTIYKYPNRTGKETLSPGEKVYLIYQTNNISQGWLESSSPLKISPTFDKDYKIINSSDVTGSTYSEIIDLIDNGIPVFIFDGTYLYAFSYDDAPESTAEFVAYNLNESGNPAAIYTYIEDGISGITTPETDRLARYSELTDTKVTQTVRSNDANYPLLLAPSGQTSTKTTTANFATNVTYNPSGGQLTVARKVLAGSTSSTAENWVQAASSSGTILLDSVGNASGNGARGIWVGAHGTATSGKWALSVDTNNNVTLNGNATTATSATNATNATNVAVALGGTTTATNYYPTMVNDTASGNYGLIDNASFRYNYKEGTASAEGLSMVILGNATSVGTAKNQTGQLRLYSDGSGYVNIKALSGLSGSKTLSLPNQSGTVAVTTDIPTSFSMSIDSLWSTNTTGTASWANFGDYAAYIIFVYGIASSSDILTSGIVPAAVFGTSSSSTFKYRLADDDTYITLDLYKSGTTGYVKRNAGSSGTGISKIYGIKTVVQ